MHKRNHFMSVVPGFISVTLVLASCTSGEDSDGAKEFRGDDGIEFESRFVGATDVDGIRLEYVQVDCDTGEVVDPGDSGTAGPVQLAGDGTIKIPGGISEFEGTLDKDSEHVFADILFIPSPVGEGDEFCYDLITYPVKEDGTDSEDCEPTVKKGVQYRRGELTEGEIIINQCLGVDPGGIDVVDALNHEPEIVDFYFDSAEKSKFVCEGEEQVVCATVIDPDKDPVEFEWTVDPAGQNVAGPSDITRTVDEETGAVTECATFVGGEAGRYTINLTVYDMMVDTDGSPIKIEDWLNREQEKLAPEGEEPELFESHTSFDFFFYAIDEEDCCRCPEVAADNYPEFPFELSEDGTFCERTLQETVTANSTIYDVCAGATHQSYGDYGALYPDGAREKNSFWGDDNGTSVNGRLNDIGLWSCNRTGGDWGPTNEWIGFAHCLELEESATYVVGSAADNSYRLEVDGAVVELQVAPNNGVHGPFKNWRLTRIDLAAGAHTIEMTASNLGSEAAFAAEIYGPFTAAQVADDAAMESALQVYEDGLAEPVFSTGTLRDQAVTEPGSVQLQIGEDSGWSCPDADWTVNVCNPAAECMKHETAQCVGRE